MILICSVVNEVCQLLNRNPKYRLGAQRDAAELKDHPFFKSIDWQALALKQVTPPFKPVVESDESVTNFDPEFTTANIRDAGPAELLLDEEDPSEDWVSLSQTNTAPIHTPNGPLGSDRPPPVPVPAATPVQGIEITPRRKREPVGTPLTSSVQENFRGFTYHGESFMPTPAGVLDSAELALDDDELSPRDEVEADEGLVGRYADRRRGGDMLDGFDDDMNV